MLAGILGILFVTHWVVLVSILPFLNADSPWQRAALVIALIVLGLSFIFASVAAHYWENTFTRSWYFFSGIWLGLMANLVLLFTAAWIVIGVGVWMGGIVPLRPVMVVAAVLAVCITAYGVWAAMTPAVTRVTVHIANLPESWKGRTIVQLSDVHIGHIYRAEWLAGVVTQVNDLHPKMVVITGDLFDGMDGVLEDSIMPLKDLQSDEGTFFVTGNHETYLGVERVLSALRHTPLKILYDEVVDVDGLQLIGIDYPKEIGATTMESTLRSLAPQFSNKPNVLLFHSPVHVDDAKQLGVNLFLAGHTHRAQMWPLRYITYYMYQGYDYGLHTEGDFNIFTTSGLGSWGPPVRTGTRSEIVAITLE